MLYFILREIPAWMRVVILVVFAAGVVSGVYSFHKCGTKAFFLGNGAFFAAVSGMCDQ